MLVSNDGTFKIVFLANRQGRLFFFFLFLTDSGAESIVALDGYQAVGPGSPLAWFSEGSRVNKPGETSVEFKPLM